MIVTCERCETKFQLDESRVPEGGARVRCSRCKHAFVVARPASTGEEAIHAVASRAIEGDDTPDVTQDLTSESIAKASSDDSDADWQFNDDRAAGSPDGAPFGEVGLGDAPNESLVSAGDATRGADRPLPIPPSAIADAELGEELGSPVDWDIFEDMAAPPAAVVASPPQRSSPAARGAASSGDRDAGGEDAPVWLRRAAIAAGWCATAGLCAVALLRGLTPPSAAAVSWPNPVPGVALEQVRGRWLDNAQLGRIYVVSGRLRNTGPAFAALPALVLELRDAAGRPVGDPIPLGEPSASEELRHAGAGELAPGRGIAGSLRGGEARAFETVAWPLPPNATRFSIRAESPAPGA